MKYKGGDKPVLGRAQALAKPSRPKSTMATQASMVKAIASKVLIGKKK